MNPVKALQEMVRRSGKSQRLISIEIGRHPTYVASLLYGKSRPQIDTFVSIAKACNCEVIVRFPEEEVELEGWQVVVQEDETLTEG